MQQTLFCRPNDLQSDTENIWHGRNDRRALSGKLMGNQASYGVSLQQVYILLKIFKLIYGVEITSFSLKFAIDRALGKGSSKKEIGKEKWLLKIKIIHFARAICIDSLL